MSTCTESRHRESDPSLGGRYNRKVIVGEAAGSSARATNETRLGAGTSEVMISAHRSCGGTETTGVESGFSIGACLHEGV